MFIFLLLIIEFMLLYKFFILIQSILYKVKIDILLESINSKEDLLFISFKDFVNVMIEVFKRKGYKVKITNKCGEEGNGLILNNIKYAEMFKHGLKHIVDVEVAMNLAKCMRSNSIYRGMLITLGDFKHNTKVYCYKNVIECINGEQLLEMCKDVQKRKEVLETS